MKRMGWPFRRPISRRVGRMLGAAAAVAAVITVGCWWVLRPQFVMRDPNVVTADEYAVYSALIQKLLSAEGPGRVVVYGWTSHGDSEDPDGVCGVVFNHKPAWSEAHEVALPFEHVLGLPFDRDRYWELLKFRHQIDRVMIEDFKAKDTRSYTLAPHFDPALAADFYSRADRDRHATMESSKKYAEINKMFPSCVGDIQFSRVGFNARGDRALVFGRYGRKSNSFADYMMSVLVKDNAGWHIHSEYMDWYTEWSVIGG